VPRPCCGPAVGLRGSGTAHRRAGRPGGTSCPWLGTPRSRWPIPAGGVRPRGPRPTPGCRPARGGAARHAPAVRGYWFLGTPCRVARRRAPASGLTRARPYHRDGLRRPSRPGVIAGGRAAAHPRPSSAIHAVQPSRLVPAPAGQPAQWHPQHLRQPQVGPHGRTPTSAGDDAIALYTASRKRGSSRSGTCSATPIPYQRSPLLLPHQRKLKSMIGVYSTLVSRNGNHRGCAHRRTAIVGAARAPHSYRRR